MNETSTAAIDQLLTTREAAKLLNLSTACLAKWRMLETGPEFISLSATAVRYSRHSIEQWLAARREETAAKAAEKAAVRAAAKAANGVAA